MNFYSQMSMGSALVRSSDRSIMLIWKATEDHLGAEEYRHLDKLFTVKTLGGYRVIELKTMCHYLECCAN